MESKRALLVGLDNGLCRRVTTLLRARGCEPLTTASLEDAVDALLQTRFCVTVVDAGPRGLHGRELLRRLEAQRLETGPTIFLARGDVTMVDLPGHRVLAAAPLDPDELERAVREVLPETRPHGDGEEATQLRQEMALCCSPRMQEIWDIVNQTAGVDITVLICGETGTGKDVIARAIHELSNRRAEPFVKVNCAAVPRELLESELFGHERGAFTGAHQLKIGKFESANRGTVFLDEIGELHPALQAKLLHVLQDGTFSRVGGKSTIKVDVRILAATNQDLEGAVLTERFRQDLYYRLNVIQIRVPPLRERVDEIPRLAEYFVRRYATTYKNEAFQLSPRTIERLTRYSYPGNVRELENLIKRMIVLNDADMQRTGLPKEQTDVSAEPAPTPEPAKTLSLKDIAQKAARAAEREAIERVLLQTSWNRVRAARILRISYRALLYKIKYAGLGRHRSAAHSG